MPDWPSSAAQKQIGFLDIIGHSGIADSNGVSQPDHGPAHKIDQFLQPAVYRSCAMGSAVHSRSNNGNGTTGDGGWAQAANEFPRDELVTGYNATTLNGAVLAAASSIVVTSAGALAPLQYLVLGDLTTPGNCEIVQVASTYVGGTTVALQSPTANSHATASPGYYAIKNQGKYVARSAFCIIDTGGNDIPYIGPGVPPATLSSTWQNGTFGTTPGASRGLTPFMHALRFTIAQMRCSVIYKDSHPSSVFGANWNTFAMSGAVANNGVATNPVLYNFGGALGTYHYTTIATSNIKLVTPPDYNGQPVCIFNFSYKDGGGAIWDYSVSGATTVAMTSHAAGTVWDDRNINAVNMNDVVGLATGSITGSAKRITGLNAGVNVITLQATTINIYGIFLGWGIEAEIPPIVDVVQQFRLGGYGTGYGYGVWDTITGTGYVRRIPKTTQTATVAAGAGTVANSVTLGTAVTVGSTVTANTAVYPGDTITLGYGTATEETRRIVGVDSTTTLHVDANFVNAHNSGAANNGCIIGYQDADFVGGGYANTADTQGALSVPGLNGAVASVEGEFDQYSTAISFDPLVNPPGAGSAPPAQGTNKNLANDGVHMSDTGAGVVADGLITKLYASPVPTQKQLASYAVPNRRTFIPTYGDSYPTGQQAAGSGAQSQFVNGWTSYWPMSNGTVYKTGFYKDSRTRMVECRGAITNYTGVREDQLPLSAFIIPVGLRPPALTQLTAWTSMGPASMEAHSDGFVYVTAGFFVLTAPPPTSGGAYLEFYGHWTPES